MTRDKKTDPAGLRSRVFSASWVDGALGCAVMLLVSVAGLLLCAWLLLVDAMPESWITFSNGIVKVIACFAGVLVACRRHPDRGWLRGLITSLCYVLAARLIYLVLQGQWVDTWAMLWELLMCGAAGTVTGMIAVNLHGKLRIPHTGSRRRA